MTIKELSQLYWLNREIEMDKRRLEELEVVVSSPKAPKARQYAARLGIRRRLGHGAWLRSSTLKQLSRRNSSSASTSAIVSNGTYPAYQTV